jgi:cytochrome c553
MRTSHHIPNRFLGWVRTPLFIASLLLISAIVVVHTAWAVDSRKVEKMIEDSLPETEQALSAEKRKQLLESGKGVYQKFCVHCHGPKGQGDGNATPYLSPQPRNLRSGIFKFHSTQNNALPRNRAICGRVFLNFIPLKITPCQLMKIWSAPSAKVCRERPCPLGAKC